MKPDLFMTLKKIMERHMNRKFVFYLLVFASFSAMAQPNEQVSLKDAIKQKLVMVSGQYNEGSVHYLRPVVLALVSLVARLVKLKIESGDLMEPADSSCQTMMVVRDTFFVMKPKQKAVLQPFGMCIEPSDGAGRAGLKYKFIPNKNAKLIEIAKFINDNKYHDGVGQQAVWCVADMGKNLLNINGYDSVSRLKLITKVAAITEKKMPSKSELSQGYENYVRTPQETIGGSFEFKFSDSKKVHIAMFNSQGIVVRELYYNANEKPGVHKVNFEFDYTVYTDEYYDIKLIANEEVMLTSRVDRNNDNWEEE